MFWIAARQIFEECKRLGLCRSQRDFSRHLLGRGPHYLRLVSNRRAFVTERTTRMLRRRLTARVGQVAPDEIAAIFQAIDRANEMARWLRRRS